MDEDKCIYSTVGFTGHIPGYRDEFGHSYGLTVSRLLSLPHPNDPPPPPPKRYHNCHCQRLTHRKCCNPNKVEEMGDNGYTMPEFNPCRSHCNGGRNHRFSCDPSFSKLQRDRRCFIRNLINCCEMGRAADNCCPKACPDNCDGITLPCVTCHNQCSQCKTDNDPSAYESMRRRFEEQSRLHYPLSSWPYEKTAPCQQPNSLIPGYAGYVPFERGIYGVRRGEATKEGLRRFQKCVKQDCGTVDLPNGRIFDCATEIEYENPNKPACLEGQNYNTFSESTDRPAGHSRTCCANCHPPVSNETSPCPCSDAVSPASHRKC